MKKSEDDTQRSQDLQKRLKTRYPTAPASCLEFWEDDPQHIETPEFEGNKPTVRIEIVTESNGGQVYAEAEVQVNEDPGIQTIILEKIR